MSLITIGTGAGREPRPSDTRPFAPPHITAPYPGGSSCSCSWVYGPSMTLDSENRFIIKFRNATCPVWRHKAQADNALWTALSST
jgi:hypothetical protein